MLFTHIIITKKAKVIKPNNGNKFIKGEQVDTIIKIVIINDMDSDDEPLSRSKLIVDWNK